MTRGVRTSEFWLSLAAVILAAIVSQFGVTSESGVGKAIAVASITLTALGYTVSRASLKKEEIKLNSQSDSAAPPF